MLRLAELSCTALRISDLARRMNRWRLARFFPLGLRRRSTICMKVCLLRPGALPRLLDAHVPFDQATHLPLGVAARCHTFDEFSVLLLALAVLLGPEADDRQQL